MQCAMPCHPDAFVFALERFLNATQRLRQWYGISWNIGLDWMPSPNWGRITVHTIDRSIDVGELLGSKEVVSLLEGTYNTSS
jgi:hypothetical protein